MAIGIAYWYLLLAPVIPLWLLLASVCVSYGGLGGQGPGPDPFGLAWGARVLGRTLLVWLGGPGSWAGPAYTINMHELFMMLI